MRKKFVWNDEYKGIAFEIVNWGLEPKPPDISHILCTSTWNTYFYLNSKRHKNIVEKLWTTKKKVYDWGTILIPNDIFERLSWNGGQTFYEQKINYADKVKMIKIGDDFNHSWDKEREHMYNENYMEQHIKEIIDEFIERTTFIKEK